MITAEFLPTRYEFFGHRPGALQQIWKCVGGGHMSGAYIFGRAPPLFLALQVQLVTLVSAFMMGSTVRSVSCLLFFYSWCPVCPATCKSGGGHLPPPPVPYGVGTTSIVWASENFMAISVFVNLSIFLSVADQFLYLDDSNNDVYKNNSSKPNRTNSYTSEVETSSATAWIGCMVMSGCPSCKTAEEGLRMGRWNWMASVVCRICSVTSRLQKNWTKSPHRTLLGL